MNNMEGWQNEKPEVADWQNEHEDRTIEDWKKIDSNRDNYTRCKFCRELWHKEQCILDGSKGYQCPDGCVETFEQPPYVSPING